MGLEKALRSVGGRSLGDAGWRCGRAQVPVRNWRSPRAQVYPESLNTISDSSDKTSWVSTNDQGCRPIFGRQKGGQTMETQLYTKMDNAGGDLQEGSFIALLSP